MIVGVGGENLVVNNSLFMGSLGQTTQCCIDSNRTSAEQGLAEQRKSWTHAVKYAISVDSYIDSCLRLVSGEIMYHIISYHIMPYHAIPDHTIPYWTIPRYNITHYNTLYITHYTLSLHRAIQHPRYAIPYYILYTLYYILYVTYYILYYTITKVAQVWYGIPPDRLILSRLPSRACSSTRSNIINVELKQPLK